MMGHRFLDLRSCRPPKITLRYRTMNTNCSEGKPGRSRPFSAEVASLNCKARY